MGCGRGREGIHLYTPPFPVAVDQIGILDFLADTRFLVIPEKNIWVCGNGTLDGSSYEVPFAAPLNAFLVVPVSVCTGRPLCVLIVLIGLNVVGPVFDSSICPTSGFDVCSVHRQGSVGRCRRGGSDGC